MSMNPNWIRDEKFHERETMHNTKAAAASAKRTETTMDEIAEAMRRQLDVAESARADARQAERFTRATALISLFVAVASLGAAIAAVVVAIPAP